MGRLSAKLRSIPNGVAFWCPGCNETHHITTNIWAWNGDVNLPTFSPSVLVTSGHHMSSHQGDCWCDYNRKHQGEPASFQCGRCHSFVKAGRIEFLNDCTHALAGQTVDLPDLPPHMLDEPVASPLPAPPPQDPA